MKEASRAWKEPSPGFSGFRGALLWRLKDLRRLWNDRLQGHQDLLLALLLILAAGIGTLVLFRVLGLALRGSGRSPGEPAIAFEGEIRETEFPKTKFKQAPAAKEGSGKEAATIEPRLPRIDWADRELRRRAASQVSLEGDLQEALRLLPPDDPDREELLQVPSPLHEEVLKALEETYRAEDRRLDEFLRSTSGDAGAARPPRAPPEEPPGEGGRPALSRAELLRSRSEGLPETLLLEFAVNLHRALRDRTGASDAHLKLLLEPCFPPRSAARKKYLERKDLRTLEYGGAPGEERRGM